MQERSERICLVSDWEACAISGWASRVDDDEVDDELLESEPELLESLRWRLFGLFVVLG